MSVHTSPWFSICVHAWTLGTRMCTEKCPSAHHGHWETIGGHCGHGETTGGHSVNHLKYPHFHKLFRYKKCHMPSIQILLTFRYEISMDTGKLPVFTVDTRKLPDLLLPSSTASTHPSPGMPLHCLLSLEHKIALDNELWTANFILGPWWDMW